MGVLLAVLGLLVMSVTIFSLPLFIAERWMNKQERTVPSPSKQRQRNLRYQQSDVNRRKDDTKRAEAQQTLLTLFESIISMQTKIAKSDGKISVNEAQHITGTINHFIFLARQNGFHASQLSPLREKLVQAHQRAKTDHTFISVYAQKLIQQHSYTKEQVLQQLIAIAVVDGYTQLKESLIFNAGTTMGFNSLQIRRYIDNLRGTRKGTRKEPAKEDTLYKILECSPTDSNASIKKSYRMLVKKYHSDLMHSQALDEAYLESAKKKLQEINMAYAKIKKSRGI